MTIVRKIFIAACLQFLILNPLFAANNNPGSDKGADEVVNYLSMAAIMLRDGHFDRAAALLEKIDLEDKKLDKKRFFTLRGIVRLKQQNYSGSISDIQHAITLGKAEPVMNLYLAQGYFATSQYQKAVDSIEAAAEEGKAKPGTWLLKSESYWRMGDKQAAWLVLTGAENLFPENYSFKRRKAFMLIELGFYQEAARLGMEYVESANVEVKDYVAFGVALRKSNQLDKALLFLEQANLRFDNNVSVLKALAHVYLDKNRLFTAGELLGRAAEIDGELSVDAAEMQRRAGSYNRALFINAKIGDQKKKLKQRLALLLDMQRFEQAIAIEPDIRRVGLLSDQSIRYALAFSYYKTGDFDKAEQLFSTLTENRLFRKATEIRKIMLDCSEERWRCL